MRDSPRAFVVGHPIAHSRSPLIHGHWLKEHGIAGSYEPIDVAPQDFPAFVAAMRTRGFVGGNVTIPHKEAAFGLVDEPSERARRLMAANTLWFSAEGRLCGDNTDVAGFLASADGALGAGWEQDCDCALVLGAGGAARAVVAGLLERGVRHVRVANRTAQRAEHLVTLDRERVAAIAMGEVPEALARTRILVNTTSLGMSGQPPLSIDLAPMPLGAAVADIVYAPLETSLLRQARERGLRTVDGLGMLLHQAAPGFARWFGVRPEVTPALRALIAADLEQAK